jgi:hypothetical protein
VANCALGWPIYSDNSVLYTPSYSGGNWLAALPLTNLKDRRVGLVARSTNALAASTQFDVDLGVARAVGLLAIVGHNLSPSATVRWIGGTSAGGTQVYDSTAEAVTYSGATAEDRVGLDFTIVKVPSSVQTARYWGLRISDTANADGYVEMGRVIIAGKFQPTVNLAPGAGMPFEDDTVRTVTDGSSAVYDAKPVRRVATFLLDHQTEAESFNSVYKMQYQLGKSGQVLFVFDTADTTYLHLRSFLGVMTELNGLQYPWADRRQATPFRIVEEL